MSSLKSRFFKSIFTVGFEENPFSTTILENIELSGIWVDGTFGAVWWKENS